MSDDLSRPRFTQEDFNRLPGLVSRQVFLDWTGLGEEQLSLCVREGTLAVWRRDTHAHALYLKTEIARLTGYRL